MISFANQPLFIVKDKEKKYELYYVDNKDHPPFFLVNEHSEGMSLTEKQLFDMLDEYFKKEF